MDVKRCWILMLLTGCVSGYTIKQEIRVDNAKQFDRPVVTASWSVEYKQ